MIRERLAAVRSSRLWQVRIVVLLVVVALLVPSAVSALTHESLDLQRGTIDEPANGTTVIAVQGYKISGQNSTKKPARLVGVGPRGGVQWVHEATDEVRWFYDVDPLEDGTLLVVATNTEQSIVFRYDPATDERLWTERFDFHDTHDVDLINDDELLIANMRGYNETTERNGERLLVYNRTQEEVTWEWEFERIYDREDGGSYTGDWTHVNDVDKIDEGRYLASPRNMDEVIVVNRSTKDVELRLGEDGNHSVLYEQHNPMYLEGAEGDPTVLVADSENDRIVEYEIDGGGDWRTANRTDADWNRTWELGTGGQFNWPRDADRLPSGNTLVTDSLNHRVMEVTPEGEIVWEFYSPWAPYEAERVALGDEPGGPTIADQNATGAHPLNNSAQLTPGSSEGATFGQWLRATAAGTPVESQVDELAARWSHVVPWIRPVWMDPWAFVAAVGATLVTVGWAGGELVYNRRRIWAAISGLLARIRRLADDDAPPGPTEAAGDDSKSGDTSEGADTTDD